MNLHSSNDVNTYKAIVLIFQDLIVDINFDIVSIIYQPFETIKSNNSFCIRNCSYCSRISLGQRRTKRAKRIVELSKHGSVSFFLLM